MNEYGEIGTNRRILSSGWYTIDVFVPILALHYLASKPPNILNTYLKQAIALPLMVSLVAVPYFYRDKKDGLFCVLCQVVSFSTFQRFSEIFWIRPLIYKTDAYISISDLKNEFWSPVRIRASKESTAKKKNTSQKAERKFYYLLPCIVMHLILSDIFAAHLRTFNGNDILYMQKHNKFRYFIVFFSGVTFMTALFNFCGQMLQLAYAITIGQGSYSPDDWRLMMNYPVLANSLEDIWSKRWHRVFRVAWISCAFKPIYYLLRERTRHIPSFKYIALGTATFAVFLASGIMHEYLVLCNAGWAIYRKQYAGDQLIFFGMHGMLVVSEKVLEQALKHSVPRSIRTSLVIQLLRHLYVVAVAFWTLPWFMTSFAPWGFDKLPFVTPIGDKTIELLSVNTFFRQYCGSCLQ